MFGLLKNKLSSFINGLAGRKEKKEKQASPPPEEAKLWKEAGQPAASAIEIWREQPSTPPLEKVLPPEKPAQARRETGTGPQIVARRQDEKPAQARRETGTNRQSSQQKQETQQSQPREQPASAESAQREQAQQTERAQGKQAQGQIERAQAQAPGQQVSQSAKMKNEQAPSQDIPRAQQKTQHQGPGISSLSRRVHAEKREMAPKIGIGTAIKSFFSNEITIGESEVSDLLEELELSLLEADVAYDVSLDVSAQLKKQLVGMKVPKGEVAPKTREAIRRILESVMESDRKFDLVSRARSLPRPVKILFVGPNGAGKTTTMAKVARMLLDSGLTVVFSASDTFRAAAIEQTEVHADKLGVKAIKSKYGADPASVAFDAINYAGSHGIDVVLIDSAGRQDTNANLLSELKKIARVAKPDLKIYIGESIGGNAVIEQIRAFDSVVGLDGAILTKIDCDSKGGTAISIAKSTGIPLLYLGVGQGYSDLVPFDPKKIAEEIMT